ncbi:N-acetylmuramoyl-L-alanine amidase [Anaerosinus massiliensis]|uniref:N-acetylmuramoyl-L-alanine amidase n=1 Tax=Massilibacillus massiliensis TaxID=1806837 RepID=UPI000B32D1DD|nr:N-acetylmuramoyl-L-alanine amidase [Massilibacillus massiliensis]
MRKSILLWLVLVCFIASPAMGFAAGFSERVSGLARVDGVRIYNSGDKVRVVLDTSGPVDYKTFVLSNPNRIAIDMKGAWLSPDVGKVTAVNSSLVGKVRVSQFDASTVRVVVEANVSKDQYDIFSLKENPAADKANRIVMDFGNLAHEETHTTVPASESTSGTTLPDADAVVTKNIKLFDVPGLKDKIIAIDPGHGGSDSGAVGPDRSKEKDITFEIGLELKQMLEGAGAKVIMTRSADMDVAYANASAKEELQARADIANRANADVFVSIHLDAFVNAQVKGTSSYYYPKTNGDERLAKFVREGVISQLGTVDRSTRTCNFYVVKHTKMPATLVEVAFISNPEEGKFLQTAAGVKKAATGIFRGLDRYFSYE